jgi:hypothetical protein
MQLFDVGQSAYYISSMTTEVKGLYLTNFLHLRFSLTFIGTLRCEEDDRNQ